MKLLLCIALNIAVLTVDCHKFPGGPEETQQLKKTADGALGPHSPTRHERPGFPPHGHKRHFSFHEDRQLKEKDNVAPGRDSPEVFQQLMKAPLNMTGIQESDLEMEDGQHESELRWSNKPCKPSCECTLAHGRCMDMKKETCIGRWIPECCKHKCCGCCIQECPPGFFRLPGSTSCVKYYTDKARDWEEASNHCKSKSLVLAHPQYQDIINLAIHSVDEANGDLFCWLNARGNGVAVPMEWKDTLTTISSDYNPFWFPSPPTTPASSTDCLALSWFAYADVTTPMRVQPCAVKTLCTACELVLPVPVVVTG